MAGDQQHIHDPAKAEEFARAVGLQIGGEGHPFVGNWGTKGLYAYSAGQYSGIAYFGTWLPAYVYGQNPTFRAARKRGQASFGSLAWRFTLLSLAVLAIQGRAYPDPRPDALGLGEPLPPARSAAAATRSCGRCWRTRTSVYAQWCGSLSVTFCPCPGRLRSAQQVSTPSTRAGLSDLAPAVCRSVRCADALRQWPWARTTHQDHRHSANATPHRAARLPRGARRSMLHTQAARERPQHRQRRTPQHTSSHHSPRRWQVRPHDRSAS